MLKKFDAGKHTVTVVFDDGKADTTLTVVKNSANGSGNGTTQTGDETPVMIWVVLIALAGICIAFLSRRARRHN